MTAILSLVMNADILTSSAGGWNCNYNFNDFERIAVNEILNNGTVIVMPAGKGWNGTRNTDNGDDCEIILDKVSHFSALKDNYFNSIICARLGA
ncbi:MAG: hypothetical protein LBI45_03370 [Bacteroidales bacterium]|nr:hypothetical protein [Bacteroidales bacterium]